MLLTLPSTLLLRTHSHSTGRGGRANLTSLPSPPLEATPAHAHEYEATGRGGAGNIRSRSASRGPGGSRSRSASRGPSQSKDRGSSLARMLNKVGLHHTGSRGGEGADDDSAVVGLAPAGMTAVVEDGEAGSFESDSALSNGHAIANGVHSESVRVQE